LTPGRVAGRSDIAKVGIMSDEATLEQRLAVVEQTVADLQRRLAGGPPPSDWLEKVVGSITDEAAFLEALEFGRAFRSADRPPDEAADSP
jgi:hypothetical protein